MSNITKPCGSCGNDFTRAASRKQDFCSHTCRGVSLRNDLVGRRFGRLTITARSGSSHWAAQCDCGKTSLPRGQSLIKGESNSCGCLNLEAVSLRFKKHGLSDNPLHKVWRGIIRRCENPKAQFFDLYGGRGITVSNAWHDFDVFLADMGEPPAGHSLDRKDGNGPYSKDNCRWATSRQQQRNRRDNQYVTYDGETKLLVAWAEQFSIPVNRTRKRIVRGWPLEEAFGIVERSK